jgi:hypothetical protein
MTTDHSSPTSHTGHATPTTPQNTLINLSYVALPPDASKADIRHLARSLGLDEHGTKEIRQRIIDMINTKRDEEWLIKGTIPAGYIEGP